MKLRLLVAATAVAVGATTCSVAAPAAADIPNTSGRHGVDAGWVRASCAVNATAAKCAIRFPEGTRRLEVDYVHGGTPLGTETSWDRTVAPRARGQIRRVDVRVASGVTLDCLTVGAVAYCTVDLANRFTDFNITTYSAGSMLGGVKGKGVGVPDPVVVEEPVVVVDEGPVGGEVIDLAPYEEIPTVVTQVTVPVVQVQP